MTHTMLKVAIDNICKIIKGRVLINNKLSLLSIIKMRIIIMVTITIISDLLVLIPLLHLYLNYSVQQPWDTGDDDDDKECNIKHYF